VLQDLIRLDLRLQPAKPAKTQPFYPFSITQPQSELSLAKFEDYRKFTDWADDTRGVGIFYRLAACFAHPDCCRRNRGVRWQTDCLPKRIRGSLRVTKRFFSNIQRDDIR
jgi:hypothetical protein